MKRICSACIIVFLYFLLNNQMQAQGYISYFTGDSADVTTNPVFGVCMMGGRTEQDHAMIRFLQYADSGDVVVLRASGSDGYNNYMYSELGVSINSVESFVITSREGAVHDFVLKQVCNAEAVWIAGGDQYNYVKDWKGTPLEDTLNWLINVKKIPVGGTSAGMAVLGGIYFSARNGTITSKEALNNPFHSRITLGNNDFLDIPFMKNVITDTHYDREESDGSVYRKGRHVAFMARAITDWDVTPYGIACEEYTAVFIDTAGIARIYGSKRYEDYAYFLQMFDTTALPEICKEGSPLTWDQNKRAVSVYKIKGNEQGSGYFNLQNWNEGAEGVKEAWYVEEGTLIEQLLSVEDQAALNPGIQIYPNPTSSTLTITSRDKFITQVEMINLKGHRVFIDAPNTRLYHINDLKKYNNEFFILALRLSDQTHLHYNIICDM